MLSQLIEEAYKLHENNSYIKKIYDQHDSTLLNASQVLIPGVQRANGIIYGLRTDPDKIDSALAGLVLAKEGALGYQSTDNDNLSIKDVYSNGGVKRKILGGALGGAALGGIQQLLIPEEEPTSVKQIEPYSSIISNSLIGAATLPTAAAMNYGLGKMAGKITNKIQGTKIQEK